MGDSELWASLDEYFDGELVVEDDALLAARRATAEAGMPDIAVAANQGKFLQLLAQVHRAHRILEIGTLGGYSTIWLARALPLDGTLITLEQDPKHARVARENIERAGLSGIVEVRQGVAMESLYDLRNEDPFDMVFIDADKVNNPGYLGWAIRLGRPGTLIVVDNVVRGGRVLDAGSRASDVVGTRRAIEYVGENPRLDGVVLQTVGVKGHDGFLIARVVS